MKIARTWDELPPIVSDQGQEFSTRILERKYRIMVDALQQIASGTMSDIECFNIAYSALTESGVKKEQP